MEFVAGYSRLSLLAHITYLTDYAADLVMLLDRLSYRGIGNVNAVLLVQRLEDVVLALQHKEVHAVFVRLERDLHVLVEEAVVPLAHGSEQLHILDAAVHHGAAVGGDNAVGKIVSAFDGTLKQCPRRLAQEACHVVGRNVHRAGVRCEQAHAECVAEIHQRLRRILADICDADLPLLLGLIYQLIISFLQEVFKVSQILQFSHSYSPIHIFCIPLQ